MDLQPSKEDIERIVEMAWEDRTPFDAITQQFGLTEKEIKLVMKERLKPSSYRLWRKRVQGRLTKHLATRSFTVGRHRSSNQNKI